MATPMSTFRSLGVGIKFDVKRFRKDAEKFQLVKPQLEKQGNDQSSQQKLATSLNQVTSLKQYNENIHHNKVKMPANDQEGDLKRKIIGEDYDSNPQKKKRRRKKKPIGEDFGMEESAITLISSQTAPSEKELLEDLGNESEGGPLVTKRQQAVNTFRNKHKIRVTGTDIPDPVTEFSELQKEYRLHQDIIENIHRMGYAEPTPVQMQVIPVMLHGRELLACAPTGSGKTAAFILPILHQLKEPRNQGIRAVVLSPTRELASQTYREFMRLSEGREFRIHLVDKIAKVSKLFKSQYGQKFDILIATPKRLVYMLQLEPPAIKLNSVEWLIVDESDKLFEKGINGFRKQLATIYQACDSSRIRRALFSATYATDVEKWCKLNLDNIVTVMVGCRNTATELVKQELMFVGGEFGKLLAVRDIFNKGFQPPVLIFVQSKERARELFHELIYDGYNVDVIHADKTQEQRENVVKSFRGGKIWVLIATELMGRGIDFKGVNLVINYDFPTSAISYIHRIGRTGRAGRKGRAVTFFTEDDAICLRSIVNVMRNAGCDIPDYMLKMKKMSKKDKTRLIRKPIRRQTIKLELNESEDIQSEQKESNREQRKGQKKKKKKKRKSSGNLQDKKTNKVKVSQKEKSKTAKHKKMKGKNSKPD